MKQSDGNTVYKSGTAILFLERVDFSEFETQPEPSLLPLQGGERLISGNSDDRAGEWPDLSYGSETEELVCFMAKQLLSRDHEGG